MGGCFIENYIISLILNILKTVKIIFVCLTAMVLVIFNWHLTNVLTNYLLMSLLL